MKANHVFVFQKILYFKVVSDIYANTPPIMVRGTTPDCVRLQPATTSDQLIRQMENARTIQSQK